MLAGTALARIVGTEELQDATDSVGLVALVGLRLQLACGGLTCPRPSDSMKELLSQMLPDARAPREETPRLPFTDACRDCENATGWLGAGANANAMGARCRA